MPAPRKQPVSGLFQSLRTVSTIKGERHDCTVVAIAIVCSVPYSVAHEALAAAGRKNRHGTHRHIQRAAIEALGFSVREWTAAEMIALIQSYGKKISSITTHHPARFPKQWEHRTNLLLYTRGHVSALKDGCVHDWAEGRAKQVWTIWEVTKKEGN